MIPARLTVEQAGWVLNGQSHDIPAQIHTPVVKVAGQTRVFATVDIVELFKDRSGWSR